MGLIIVGVILFVVAGGLFWGQKSAREKVLAMAGTDTFTASSLQETAGAIAKELGAGSFVQGCELKGIIGCHKPLFSELQKVQCVYFTSEVTQEFEEEYYDRDSKGNQVRRTRTHTKTVLSNRGSTEFFIEDNTGRTTVIPEGADWDAEKVVDRFEGPGIIPMLGSTGRFLGTRYKEYVVPIGKRAYVLGEARDSGGVLAVRKPEKKGHFIISLKSEEELTKSAQSSAKWMGLAAPICAVIGFILVIAGLTQL